MRLDDFNVVACGHGLRGHLQQLQSYVDTHTHVGRHHDGDVFGRFGDFCFLFVGKTRSTNDELDAQFAANSQMRQRAFGTCEINQYLAVLQAFAHIGLDVHAAGLAQKASGIVANARA